MILTALLLSVTLENCPGAVNPAHVEAVWSYVQDLVGPRDPPPLVYFTKEEEPPISMPFLAFYYEHTRVIRIFPSAIQQGGSLYRGEENTGYVYLVLGHEMLHYLLSVRVPIEEHHCYFAREGYWHRMAEWLVAQGIGWPVLLQSVEKTGCAEGRSATP